MGYNLSVIASQCQLPWQGSPWQAGPALLFVWAQWGVKCRALFSLAAAAGLCSTKGRWASSRESRQRSPVVPEIEKLCSFSTATTDSPVAPLPGELSSRRRD